MYCLIQRVRTRKNIREEFIQGYETALKDLFYSLFGQRLRVFKKWKAENYNK